MTLRHVGLLLTIAAVAGWFFVLRPTALGGPASYIFVSGVSMQPTLESGDLVVLQRAEDYAVGDVIAFEIPQGSPGAGSLVIHRIIGGSADRGFVMQGDNKPAPDEWQPDEALIAGRLWLHVPGAGSTAAWVRQPAIFASLVAGLVVFFIALGGDDGKPERRREVPADG